MEKQKRRNKMHSENHDIYDNDDDDDDDDHNNNNNNNNNNITTKPRTVITTVKKTKFICHIQCLFFKQAFRGHYLHFQIYTINSMT